MPDLIATLVHITDMHLLVDEQGKTRKSARGSARGLAWVARGRFGRISDLCAGVMWHDPRALSALQRALTQLARQLSAQAAHTVSPVAVLQGGDVEALGSSAGDHLAGYDAFPSFKYTHDQLRGDDPSWEWLDIFGNHDTWPGTFPLLGWADRARNRDRIATVPGVEGPWPRARQLTPAAQVPVVIAQLNSVSRELRDEISANGEITAHPFQGQDTVEVIEELRDQMLPWRERPAVRIVLMHHPPHKPLRSGSAGPLDDADELAHALAELRVQLVIAGHFHTLDPARTTMLDATKASQDPLAASTAQLACESPTQASVRGIERGEEYADIARRSFAVYRLWADGDGLDVERIIWRYDGQKRFVEGSGEIVLTGLSLK